MSRTALVTGGASGIGRAVVERFVKDGYRVAVLDRDPCAGVEEVAYQVDVTDGDAVTAAVDEAVAALGGLDVVVNNAGAGMQGTVADGDLDAWAALYDVNVLSVVRTTRAALPALRRSSDAAVVNVSSIAATTGLPQRASYSATKGAVLALTLAMAADHVAEGIRVNAVAPGTVDTPWVQRLLAASDDQTAQLDALTRRQPHGRLVTAEEVAGAVAYLAAPGTGSTTGAVLHVDGGMHGLRLPAR